MQVSSSLWVMRSAMKPAGTKSEGRNLAFIRLIPLWKPARQHHYNCIKTESEPERKAKWMAECEHKIADATAIDVVTDNIAASIGFQQSVEHVNGFTRRRR
jgi:hypothetical protein